MVRTVIIVCVIIAILDYLLLFAIYKGDNKYGLFVFAPARHLHCRCDNRKVEYEDMMVDDAVALDAIRCIMKNDIAIINDGVRRRPILNTSRKDCYDALFKIRSIIQDNENYHIAKVMEELHDKEKMLNKQEDDKDIQHVGYSQEACGYEK